MSILSWFVADDDDKVVAKVDVHSDGTVHEYRYTEADHIEEGHGHYLYKNLDDYENDEPLKFRDENSAASKDKEWNGNGYSMSVEDLKHLKEELLNKKYDTSVKLLLK